MPRSIEIKPNGSLSRGGALLFFASLATLCLSVAIASASAGFWPVLPFAGAELTLLGLALTWSLRAARRCERIHIYTDSVVIEYGGGDANTRREFPRHRVRIELRSSPLRNHPSQLLFRHSHRFCEVGRCLTDQERTSLRTRLGEILKD